MDKGKCEEGLQGTNSILQGAGIQARKFKKLTFSRTPESMRIEKGKTRTQVEKADPLNANRNEVNHPRGRVPNREEADALQVRLEIPQLADA